MSERPAARAITVLGATGSIGGSALDVIARHPQRFRVAALSAHTDGERLFELCCRHAPDYAVLHEPRAAQALAQRLRRQGCATRVLSGSAGLCTIASLPEVQTVVAGIVGAAGLLPTLAAARAGKRLLLANKEPLVMAGGLFMQAVRESGAVLLPIDSEHNAVFQCLPGTPPDGIAPVGVRRVVLTASGGPFRTWSTERLRAVTPTQACAHPTWRMGPKISVDSATMLNKGLEVIEACWLFGLAPEQVEVWLHPQSLIHALVDYLDGSLLAQLGHPDMRTPIAQALGWPERIDAGVAPLAVTDLLRLDFAPVERAQYPCLDLAYRALASGGAAPVVLNAANEAAVAAFLDGRLGFTEIAPVIEDALARHAGATATALDDIVALDAQVRAAALCPPAPALRRALP